MRTSTPAWIASFALSPLIVDCAGVGFCDSTGLGILVTWHQDAELQHKSLRVRAMPGRMDKIVRLTGLDVLDIEA